MVNNVFANDNELACKAGQGKSICCFPDVCMTPPESPATPPGVPVPYPNTAFARDTTDGSRTVMISRKEVMLKDISYLKTSTGNEAGRAAKKGVVTSVNKGEAYFSSWSMDVKIEGENVDRHLDLTVHNEACDPPNAATMTFVDSSAFGQVAKCNNDKQRMQDECEGKDRCPGVLNIPGKVQLAEVDKSPSKRRAEFDPYKTIIQDAKRDEIAAGRSGANTFRAGAAAEKEADGSECVKAARCYLRPYKPTKGKDGCCSGQTAHHLPPKACFEGISSYSEHRALCVCMEGMSQHAGSHGKNHSAIDFLASKKGYEKNGKCDLKEYSSLCAAAVAQQTGCDQTCLEQQLEGSFPKDIKEIKHAPSYSNVKLEPKQEDELLKAAKIPVNPIPGR